MNYNIRYNIISDCSHEMWYFSCPECGTKTDPLAPEQSTEYIFRYICGIDGACFVVECPKCFHRYKFHHSEGGYELFVITVNKGNNLHFKPEEDGNESE